MTHVFISKWLILLSLLLSFFIKELEGSEAKKDSSKGPLFGELRTETTESTYLLNSVQKLRFPFADVYL